MRIGERQNQLPGMPFESTRPRRRAGWLAPSAIFLVTIVLAQFLVSRVGVGLFVVALGGLLAAMLFAAVSFRNWLIPFTFWIAAVGGFRFLWTVQAPGLPDLYFDRMMMIWLAVVFLVRSVMTRRLPRGPYVLDLLIFLHGAYIFVRVYTQGLENVQPWFMSIVVPYAAYFFAKNIVDDAARVRALWWALLVLVAYYSLTSIAERYSLNALVFPKSILEAKELEFRGRSIGPYVQPGVFGTSFAMLIPIHLYLIATSRATALRLIAVACLLAAAVGLFFTYTRGSWLAGAFGLVVTVMLNRRSYLRILAPAAAIGAVLAIFVLGLGQDKFMRERVENDDTLGSRVGTAVTALRVWRDHPVLGVGFFQYHNVREKYIEPVEAPLLGTIRFTQFRRNALHDIYLGPLAEDGLVGATLQGGIFFLIFRNLLRKRKRYAHDREFTELIMPVCAATMSAYLIGGLAFDYRFFSVMGAFFYMTVGILEGYRNPEIDNAS